MSEYCKINAEKTEAIKIKANAGLIVADEGLQGYAMMWLNLTNNQKANKKDILKIYNDHDNGIYVICDADEENVNATEDYLQRLGLVIEYKERVAIIKPEEVFDSSGDCLDVELINW